MMLLKSSDFQWQGWLYSAVRAGFGRDSAMLPLSRLLLPAKEMSLRRPYGTPQLYCAILPQASTPRNKGRFLGTPVKRGANNPCACDALAGDCLRSFQ